MSDEDAWDEEAKGIIDALVMPEEGAHEEVWRDYFREVLWRELGCVPQPTRSWQS